MGKKSKKSENEVRFGEDIMERKRIEEKKTRNESRGGNKGEEKKEENCEGEKVGWK